MQIHNEVFSSRKIQLRVRDKKFDPPGDKEECGGGFV